MIVPETVKSLLLREEKGSFPVVAMFTTIGSPSFLAVIFSERSMAEVPLL